MVLKQGGFPVPHSIFEDLIPDLAAYYPLRKAGVS